MRDDALDQIALFHRELCALNTTGIPVALGFGSESDSVTDRLNGVYAQLTDALRQNQAIEQAIDSLPAISERYRKAIRIWLRTNDSSLALECLTRPAKSRSAFFQNVSLGVMQVGIVFSLICLGVIYLGTKARKLRGFYEDVQLEEPASIAILIAARHWCWLWLPVFVAGAIYAFVVRDRLKGWFLDLLRSVRITDSRADERAAESERLALLIDRGIPVGEALHLEGLVDDPRQDPNHATRESSPLLRWCVDDDAICESRSRVMQNIAAMYRYRAEHSASLWRYVIPLALAALVGGAMVFVFAVVLFLPYLRLIQALS